MGYDAKRYGYMTESWRAKSVKMWSWLAGLVGDAGSRLMLENVYEYGPDPVWDLFRDLPDLPVGFCLDTGHLSAFGREPLEKWIDRLGPIIGQLHLHDNGGEWDDHLALGMGNIDFPLLFQRLISIRESPPIVTLEPHREEDLWPSFDYLEGVWPW
jgi:sugar phosphate isomerase/epimerase